MDEGTPLIGLRQRSWKSYYSVSAMFRKQDAGTYAEPQGHGSESTTNTTLKRSLSVWDLIAYGLASTLGTGILVTVGQVAHQTTGPAIVFSFILAGFASFLSALCYSEFAARIPVSGSAYSFAYVSLGEIIAWFVGWNLTLEYAISASAVAGGWTSYVLAAVESCGVAKHDIPVWIQGTTLYTTDSGVTYITANPLSAFIIIVCTLVLLAGMKESARFNLAMTILNLIVILFFICLGASHVNTDHWHNFFPYGAAGTWAGVGKVFFSYIGFDSVSTLAGEVKNPKRDLPVGIVGTLLIVTVLYIIVALILTGMQPYNLIDVNAPLALAFKYVNQNWASIVIAFGSVTTITATTLCSLIGQPRIFYQMSKDGLMFGIFGKLHPKTGVPVWGTIITGLISAVIAFFLKLDILLDMISIGTLLAFTVVCGGVIILRYQHTEPEKKYRVPGLVLAYFISCAFFSSRQKIHLDIPLGWNIAVWIAFAIPMVVTFIPFLLFKATNIPSSFSCPLVPWIPCLGVLMNTWFIMSLSLDSIYRLLAWTAIGMAIYFLYGIRNSSMANNKLPSGTPPSSGRGSVNFG